MSMLHHHLRPLIVALACVLLTSWGATAATLVDPATVKSSFSQDKAQYVLTIATPTAEDSVNHYIAWRAKQLMEEKSGGKLFANVYEAGTLGGDRETIEGLQAGNIDFFVTISATFAPFAPRGGIFDLPNAYANLDIARSVMDSGFVKKLEADYAKAGLKIIGFSDAGFRQTTSSKPLGSMDDFKGLKIRTMENANHMAYWKALGANPTPMDFSEVYLSLQQGTIDAQENPYDLIVANKLYEPQKYIIETNHLLHNLTMAISKAKYDTLPADMQKIIEASVLEALKYGREVADSRIESRKKTVLDYGCVIKEVSPEMRAQMLERLKDVYAKMRKDIGAELTDEFIKLIADTEAQKGLKK